MFTLSDIEMIRAGRKILSVAELSVPTDQLTVILGHNGSGKSTLVSLLSGQQAPDRGAVRLNQRDIHQLSARTLAKSVAFLPQKLPASAGLTVRELVRLGRYPWRGALGLWQRQDSDIIATAMEKTGISALAEAYVDELSGGERQRAWVAMLLAQESPVLILDEPTSALDVQHQYQLMALLSELTSEAGCGAIVILHDLNLALRYATHIVALKQGQIAFDGPVSVLADERRLSELYQTPIRLIDHPQEIPEYPGHHAVSGDLTAHKVAVVCV
ncbi:Iron(3+)-hydroxamate import ATP-binding protein FhuC [Vibrio aerogenes CECT 7868]|uniref:Iron(3+)-hydroxamate import ATP-binding protein FhuC n=1 Tax=Vibrio aerogenes CECT 7868 TaxID=1216006 RepID=A0A1M5ZNI5_9VIBR|nr:ABC transporter ATP-binding protein [Vibrio aerogenes]SHI25790.1 Iron(3+)-hydroxamate import ATP-binding protein FhuC [Vibrio aerogenes CECT 7868]